MKICIFFLACCSPVVEFFFLVLSAARETRRPSVHATHAWDPTELRGGALSIQRRYAGSFFSRGCVPPRWAE